MKKAYKILVSGKVQGVFYRRFVKEKADELNLKGYVRNIEGGRVEIVAEGQKGMLDLFVGFLKKGNKYSQVRDVQVEERPWSGEFSEFRVLRF